MCTENRYMRLSLGGMASVVKLPDTGARSCLFQMSLTAIFACASSEKRPGKRVVASRVTTCARLLFWPHVLPVFCKKAATELLNPF